MAEIRNLDEIREQLIEMLREFEIDLYPCPMEVYAYYDEESKTVSLDTVVSGGGRNFCNDGHISIYYDEAHNDDQIDVFETVDEIANAIGIDRDTLIIEAIPDEEERAELIEEDGRELYAEVRYYADRAYSDEIRDAYIKFLDDIFDSEYYESTADEIIDTLITEVNERYE